VLWPTVSRPVCLGVKLHKIFVTVKLLFNIAAGPRQRSHSGVEVPRDWRPHILLSEIRDFPHLEGQVPVFTSPRNRLAQIYAQGTAFPFRRLLRLAGLRWRYLTATPHGPDSLPKVKVRLIVQNQSQSQSQSCFTTGGLPPISLSWRQPPWDSRPVTFLFQLNTCGHSPRIYISQKQDGPVIPPDNGFPFRCILRPAGLRCVVIEPRTNRTENTFSQKSLLLLRAYPLPRIRVYRTLA
jgi:hypothetical protein